MNDFWDKVLQFAEATTARVGDRLLTEAGKLQALQKEDGSLVTSADRWADKELTDAIKSTFPSHGVLSEETQHIFPDNDWCWIIDPIDGTTNFSRGIPIWAISLGLLYRGRPAFGFVYLPPLKQFYYGYGDKPDKLDLDLPTGAYLNRQPIRTSRDNPSPSHLFSLCARSLHILQKPFPCKIRMLGVASYNCLLVSSGCALGAVEATPKIWDLAAVYPIVCGAGGVVESLLERSIFPLEVGTNYQNLSLPTLVVARPELVSLFRPLVRSISNGDR
jgi:myo-inositol-1(or 4)-monophosphatase